MFHLTSSIALGLQIIGAAYLIVYGVRGVVKMVVDAYQIALAFAKKHLGVK